MPIVNDTQIRRLFCLYALYGDITESKLTLLRGSRAYGTFKDMALPFVLNVFEYDMAASSGRASRAEPFTVYMLALQVNYHRQLLRHGLTSEAFPYTLPEDAPAHATVQDVIDAHRMMCRIDGTEPRDEKVVEWIGQTCNTDWDLPEELRRRLKTAHWETRRVYRQLDEFCKRCKSCNERIPPVYNPNQAVAEIMEFFTHLTRGYRFHLEGNDELGLKEVDAGTRHLVRVTLDMRKAIVATVLKHRPGRVGADLTRRMLQARAKDVSTDVQNDERLALYAPEVEESLHIPLDV